MATQLNRSLGPYPDFSPAAQRDFAARLKWSVTSKYADANHASVITIKGPLNILVSPGERIRLNASVTDPDGDIVYVRWWQFRVGTYPGEVDISNGNASRTRIIIREDAVAGQTNHMVVEVTDNGSPSLTSYQRIIITVKNL